ncbi:MAG: hypothetical protein WCX46_01990 [Candidatus Paceibacterota bacterium]
MNKKEIIQSVKVLVLGLILSLGVSFVLASTSVSPSAANNIAGPLNIGPSNQAKVGGLDITGNGQVSSGNLRQTSSTSIFSAAGPALFTGYLFFNSGDSTNSAAYIRSANGYSTPTNPDYTFWYNDQNGMYHPSYDTVGFSAAGNEKIKIDGNGVIIKDLQYVNGQYPERPVCVNASGKLELCDLQ